MGFLSNPVLKICLKYVCLLCGKKSFYYHIATSHMKIIPSNFLNTYYYKQFSKLDVKPVTRRKVSQKSRGTVLEAFRCLSFEVGLWCLVAAFCEGKEINGTLGRWCQREGFAARKSNCWLCQKKNPFPTSSEALSIGMKFRVRDKSLGNQ